jgi:hypothetical protein
MSVAHPAVTAACDHGAVVPEPDRRVRQHRDWRRLALSLAALVLAIWSPAFAQDACRLDLVPKDLAVTRGGVGADVVLAAHAPAQTTITAARLSADAPSGVTVTIEGPDPMPPARGDLRWRASVKANDATPEKGDVLFSLACDLTPTSGKGAVIRLSVASLPFTTRSPTKPLSTLKARVDPITEPVDERRAGLLALTLENQGEQDLAGVSIETDFPDFLDVVPKRVDVGALAPGTILVFPFRVSENNAHRPRPGAPPPLFHVKARAASESATGVVTVAASVPLSVLGLSDALKLIQVPSFLFLPGALLLLTCDLIWRLRARNENTEFPLAWPKPAFWLGAVTLSGVAAVMYPVVTGVFGDSRDYLIAFTLTDVIWVWFVSIVSAVPVYALSAAVHNALERRRLGAEARERRKREINSDDQPIDVLRKLATLGASSGIVLPIATIRQGAETQTVLDSGLPAGPGQRWLLPPATIKLADHKQAAGIDDVLGQASNLPGVLSLLDRLMELGISAETKWVTRGPLIDRPHAWPAADITPTGGSDPLLERS